MTISDPVVYLDGDSRLNMGIRFTVHNETDLVVWNAPVELRFTIGGKDVTRELNPEFLEMWAEPAAIAEAARLHVETF